MTKWKWVIRLALVFVGAVGICSGVVFLPDSPEKEMRRLHREIDSGLRVGSSRAEVEQWLNSHGFQPYYPIGGKEHPFRLDVYLPREYCWEWNGSIHMYLFLDKDGRFSGHHLDWENFPL